MSDCIGYRSSGGLVARREDFVPSNVDGGPTEKLSYRWSVDRGRLATGQGTTKITVTTPLGYDQRIIATVEVRGLPPECPSSASESADEALDDFGSILIREIRNPSYSISMRVRAVIKESLRKNPNSQLYVVLHVNSALSQTSLDKLRSGVLKQLATTRMDAARFTIVPTLSKYRGLTIWRVPPGASDPSVVPYIPD
jgi:hypothetical protein